eukprot:766537-Hanusia_phi.AAC.1
MEHTILPIADGTVAFTPAMRKLVDRKLEGHAALSICRHDSDGLRIVYSSPSFQALFGYTATELQGKGLESLVVEEERETSRNYASLREAIQSRISRRTTASLYVEKKSRAPFWCSVMADCSAYPWISIACGDATRLVGGDEASFVDVVLETLELQELQASATETSSSFLLTCRLGQSAAGEAPGPRRFREAEEACFGPLWV